MKTKEFLQTMKSIVEKQNKKFVYNSFFDFVLTHGKEYSNVKTNLTFDELEYSLPKYCYYNAKKLSLEYPDKFTYCEGYAGQIITCSHAWCIDSQGRVIDPTWYDLDQDGLVNNDYVGVEFSKEFVKNHIEITHEGASLIDCFDADLYLMKEPFTGSFDVYKEIFKDS